MKHQNLGCRLSACEGKTAYATFEDASRHTALKVYRCRFCGSWHRGSELRRRPGRAKTSKE